ncbi:MAG: hypothetical protein ACNA8K_00420 [Cyclonatronaceae bacterium]
MNKLDVRLQLFIVFQVPAGRSIPVMKRDVLFRAEDHTGNRYWGLRDDIYTSSGYIDSSK